jgi:hypothetical protein
MATTLFENAALLDVEAGLLRPSTFDLLILLSSYPPHEGTLSTQRNRQAAGPRSGRLTRSGRVVAAAWSRHAVVIRRLQRGRRHDRWGPHGVP